MSLISCILLQAQETVVIDGITFSADKKTLIKYPKENEDQQYIVPEGTEMIGKEAIWDNCYLRILTLLHPVQFPIPIGGYTPSWVDPNKKYIIQHPLSLVNTRKYYLKRRILDTISSPLNFIQ